NLLIANSPCTINNREKINVDNLAGGIDADHQEPGILHGISSFVAKHRRLFDGNHKNGLHDIFDFIPQVYVKLTSHASSTSSYGKAVTGRDVDVDPSEFLLDVVNDAKMLRNKVEDFLSVPRNTFESEQPSS